MDHWGSYVVIFLISCFFIGSSDSSEEESLVELITNDCGDTEVRCMLKAQDVISKWLEINNMYTVLVAGKTGTGKTRLIKGFAKNITVVSSQEDKNLFPKTLKVEPYQYNYEGSKIILYDSPGLVDAEANKGDGKDKNFDYLTDMVRKNIFPDVIVFFVRMDQSVQNALDQEDEYVIRNISHAFGWAKWRYAMFVLSFANKVQNIDAEERGDEYDQNHFTLRLAEMRLHIKKLLRTLFAGKDVVKDIPIVPVGLVNEEKFVADVRDISWIKEFWSKLFKILKRSKKERKPVLDSEEENIVPTESSEPDLSDKNTDEKKLDVSNLDENWCDVDDDECLGIVWDIPD